MSGLPFRARVFCWAVIVMAVGLIAWAAVDAYPMLVPTLGLRTVFDAGTTLIAIVAIAASGLSPVRLGYKLRITVAATAAFAAALLFSPLRAMAVTVLGVLISRTTNVMTGKSPRVPQWPILDVGFNASQIMLSVGLTSLLFHWLGTDPTKVLHLSDLWAIGNIVLAMAAFFLVNNSLIATAAVLALDPPMLNNWPHLAFRGWYRGMMLLALGLLVAVVYVQAMPALIIFPVVLVLIHQAFSLAGTVQEQTKHTLRLLADELDRRDPYTLAHSQRVSEYARLTARRLGLSEQDQESIVLAGRVHDLGKIGIREDLLKRPGELTPQELDEIRRHTFIGAKIVGNLMEIDRSKDAILYHHERWDGSGIHRLAYEHIPIGARIIAVADAFDAMTSDRPYRRALSRDSAFAELEKGTGTQFDPVVVAAFTDCVKALGPETPVAAAPEASTPLPEPTPALVRH